MVPEGALRAHFIQIDVALQHNLGIRRHFQVVGLAGHHLHRLAPQEAREHHFVEVRWNRQHSRQCRRRIGANHHAYWNSAFGILRLRSPKMLRSVFLRLPVHSRRPLVVNLHPVHPDISFPGLWIPCKHQRKCDEASAILRPAFENGEGQEVHVTSHLNDFLASAGLHALGDKRTELRQLREHLDFVEEPSRRLHGQESVNSRRHLIQILHFKRQRHSSHASKRIDQHGMPRPLRVFEQ